LLFIVGIIVFSSNFLGAFSSSLAVIFLILTYISTLGGLIIFYVLTSQYKIGLSILSFLLNLILWITEQIILEKHFHNSYLYQEENVRIVFVLALGAFLWGFNKIVLDVIFLLFRPKLHESLLDKFLKKKQVRVKV
jgi:hypothetical protein